jgi:hypothetical protein
MMHYLFVGLAAAGAALAAYAGNRLAFGRMGQVAALTVVPWWEEACKLAAVVVLRRAPALSVRALSAFILPVHMVFGLIECGYDLWRIRNDGLFLGLLTLSGHGLFGGLTALVAMHSGSLWWACMAGGLAHCLYNLAVLTLVLPTLGAGAYAGTGKR